MKEKNLMTLYYITWVVGLIASAVLIFLIFIYIVKEEIEVKWLG